MKTLRTLPLQYEPWSPFDRLHSLRDLFDSAFALAASGRPSGTSWVPALDIREEPDQFKVHVELPGMKKEDFEITLENDRLVLSGERKLEHEEGRGESFRSERFFGAFRREIALPSAVNASGVAADYRDGILTVSLPKAEEAKPRKIEVSIE